MNLVGIAQVERFIAKLTPIERARIKRSQELFKEYGLQLPSKYLKRMAGTRELWELRAGNIRLFFLLKGAGSLFMQLRKRQIKHQYRIYD